MSFVHSYSTYPGFLVVFFYRRAGKRKEKGKGKKGKEKRGWGGDIR